MFDLEPSVCVEERGVFARSGEKRVTLDYDPSNVVFSVAFMEAARAEVRSAESR